MTVYQEIFQKNKKSFAVLIDPDKTNAHQADELIYNINTINEISCVLVGGSLVTNTSTADVINSLRNKTTKPVILFPGNINQVCAADAILFLNLISGRNPEYLIGQHVVGAPLIKKLGIESISTGYLLVGEPSSSSYVSNTTPLPSNKPDLIAATALAGEMIGHALIYMDAGSGASNPISEEVINIVRKTIQVPLIVGGGIRSYEETKKALDAGANFIVVGNAVENNPTILFEIASAVADCNRVLKI